MAGVSHLQAQKATGYIRRQRINIFSLPAEIYFNIFATFILEAKRKAKERRSWRFDKKRGIVDITVARRLPPRWYGGGEELPYVIEILKELLQAFAGTHIEKVIAQLMGHEFTFLSGLCESIRRLSGVMDPLYMRYIQHMSVGMDDGMKEGHEKVWPQFISVICTELPNLSKLTVTNGRNLSDGPICEADCTKSYASLLRLLSFITVQMPHTFRLILPASRARPKEAKIKLFIEKVTYPSEDSKWVQARLGRPSNIEARREWKRMTQDEGIDESGLKVVEDEVLNATAIRRLTMTELESTVPSTFIIEPKPGSCKNTITSSEVSEQYHFYDIVDQRGYRTWQNHAANNWKRRSVDEMILFCREREYSFNKRQQREKKAAARRDRRALQIVASRGLNVHAAVFTPETKSSRH